ncbi:hypothetical protein FB451DRAFT_1404955 [Mycena latifolia]|nr:hypothetical protein FB451DRAFT_1404955 [Mycena latifolia]
MLFTPTRLFHLVTLAITLNPALAWKMMVYEFSAGGTAQCTGGGTTISGGDSNPGETAILAAAALKVLSSAAGAKFNAYSTTDCTTPATVRIFDQGSGYVAFFAESFSLRP